MDLTIISDTDCKVIKIAGDFGADFVHENRPILEDSVENDSEDLRIDLSSCRFIDSSGVGALVFLFKRLVASGRTLRLTGLSGQPRDLLTFLRIHQVIDIEDAAAPANAPVEAPVFAPQILRRAG